MRVGSALRTSPSFKASRNPVLEAPAGLRKCLEAGMNKDAVQHERGPRNATKQRQAAMMFKESWSGGQPPGPALPYPSSAQLHNAPPTDHLIRLFNAQSIYNSALFAASLPLGHAPNFLRPSPPLFHPTPKYPQFPVPCSPSESVTELASKLGKTENVPELAARIIFHNVNWLKALPSFTSLPMRDQLLLLSEGWQELFLLTAMEYGLSMDADTLAEAAGITSESADTEKKSELMESIKALQSLSSEVKQLQLDYIEFYYLKLNFLFKSDSPNASPRIRELLDRQRVAMNRDSAQLYLVTHVNARHPAQQLRCFRLQRLQPALLAVGGAAIKKIFFSTIEDQADIETVICDLYANDKGLKTANFASRAFPGNLQASPLNVPPTRRSPFDPPIH
ncbi:hypothetical protein JTE90_000342 [Oedothorax gibbosus]|uniref:NR LBD domain-containing protein n=1 Tax=Oedothorax gibbosus TaxID=931172 RepID=A0AAV6U292_9ARAC|nr:hypothetical protein JTE90_000342 [Oedothorax gibbosus]